MAGAAKVDITPKESDLINKTDIIRDNIMQVICQISNIKKRPMSTSSA